MSRTTRCPVPAASPARASEWRVFRGRRIMPAPTTVEEFLGIVSRSGVLEKPNLDDYVQQLRQAGATDLSAPGDLAGALVRDGLLTQFQANLLLRGKWRGLIINGKYKLLELLG